MCMTQKKTYGYDICFDNTHSLPGDDDDVDDDDDDDDTANMSTCDMSGADDEVSEICKQQVTL